MTPLMLVPINLLAVLIAAVAAFFIGFLWHGPVFGKTWMNLMGITPAMMEAEKQKGGMGKLMAAAFVQQLLVSAVLAEFLAVWGAYTLMSALAVGFWAWLGFIATTLLNGVLWEKRKFPLYLFNIAYHLVVLLTMSLIISAFM